MGLSKSLEQLKIIEPHFSLKTKNTSTSAYLSWFLHKKACITFC